MDNGLQGLPSRVYPLSTYAKAQLADRRQGIGYAQIGLKSFDLIARHIDALQAAQTVAAHNETLVGDGQGRTAQGRPDHQQNKYNKPRLNHD